MFDKYIMSGRRRMFLKKLIWMQMLGLTGASLPWQTFTGNPLQFNAPKAHTLKFVKVEFSPKQEGSGDPSPDNVRPISGWTGVDIYNEPDYDPTATPKLTVTWQDEAGTVYGGTIDLTTGVLTGTWEKKKVSDINLTLIARNGADDAYWIRSKEYSYLNDNGSSDAFCDTFKPIKFPSKAYSGNGLQNNECSVHNGRFQFCTADYSTIASFKADYGDVEICYPITTPVTYHLPSVEALQALQGINTMWTDADNLTVEAKAEAVNLSALQSLNMLLGGRYVNNHTEEDLTDEEALDVLLGNR